jgi:hypothetical protein
VKLRTRIISTILGASALAGGFGVHAQSQIASGVQQAEAGGQVCEMIYYPYPHIKKVCHTIPPRNMM